MQLLDETVIAHGMIRVEPGEDLIAALEALAAAAGWEDAFVTGTGTLELVEISRGSETMTIDNALLTGLSGRIVRAGGAAPGDRREARLTAGLIAGGVWHSGRILGAVTGELLLVIDAVAGTRDAGTPRTPGAAARTRVEHSDLRTRAREVVGPAAVVEQGDERAATKPLSQTFSAKPVIVPRGRDAAFDAHPDDHSMDVVAGDFLEHPQLGHCEVVGEDESGGMRVRIPSGRVCVLRIDTLHVLAPTSDADGDGKRVFRVLGPKRRR